MTASHMTQHLDNHPLVDIVKLFDNDFSKDSEHQKQFFQKIAQLFLDDASQTRADITKIAGFLLQITNDETGCKGLLAAGDAFVRQYQSDKALECYEKLKSDLLLLSGDRVDALFIQMAIKYSKVSTAKQNTAQVVDILNDALTRAVKQKDMASQALIQMHLAKNEWLLNRYDKAIKTFQTGWALAGQCNDARLMGAAISFKIFFSFWQGRYKSVISHYEASVSDIEKYPQTGFPSLVTITVGQCYTYVGQITQGLGMLDALENSCREAGDLQNAAFATASINTAFLMIDSVDEALRQVEKTYAQIHQTKNDYIGLLAEGFLAYLHYLKGNTTVSVSFLKKFVHKCQKINIDILHHRPYVLELCWAMEKGQYPKIFGLSLAKEVTKLISGRNVFLKGLAYRYKALLEIRSQSPSDQILDSLLQSLYWLEISGHELEMIHTRMELLRRYLMENDETNLQKTKEQISSRLSQYHPDIIPGDLRGIFMGKPDTPGVSSIVLNFVSDIIHLSDTKELLQKILSALNQLTGSERGAVFLLNPDVHTSSSAPALLLRASKNLTMDQVNDPDFESSMGLIEQVAAAGSSQKPVIQNEVPGTSIRSRICVPICFKQSMIGVLYLDNRLLRSVFQTSDMPWFSFFVFQLAMVIDHVSTCETLSGLELKLQKERQYVQEPSWPTARFSHIVGDSAAVRKMLYLVEQVAATDAKVLIMGETGVGKELVANAIHHQSLRKHQPFIKANCSALTETLINSELFGHEQGAFTGAASRRIGRFEQADGGTLFLDEIGDLPMGVQVNLLRVIQNAEFERVGGNETIHSDFRLIVATNQDLGRQVEAKKFREDLFFRLNVFPIQVPPLRERKEDIPLLVRHFVHQFSKKMNRKIKKIPVEEMDKLMAYAWPGNIRELENTIERALVLNHSPIFRVADLTTGACLPEYVGHGHTLAENERNHILWALEQKNWKVRGADGVAQFLDIHPSTLTARMKKLGIRRP